MTKYFLILVATLLMAGCGPQIVYDYQAPASAEGRVCISQCNNQRNYCHQSENNKHTQCLNNYHMMMQNYQNCVDAKGKNCVMPAYCMAANTWQCDESYRSCFISCGGSVHSRTIEK